MGLTVLSDASASTRSCQRNQLNYANYLAQDSRRRPQPSFSSSDNVQRLSFTSVSDRRTGALLPARPMAVCGPMRPLRSRCPDAYAEPSQHPGVALLRSAHTALLSLLLLLHTACAAVRAWLPASHPPVPQLWICAGKYRPLVVGTSSPYGGPAAVPVVWRSHFWAAMAAPGTQGTLFLNAIWLSGEECNQSTCIDAKCH
ncbi:uncharacterized protein [Dermacentor andersoni]|uniref:uncharacterized protein n=1 Tax=Dermacentor andersoni TaxID=34620 RepID=UPI002417F0FA|nr:uncharacterized protein LOC129387306 [Dermacentor andersoni]XP_054932175.1 uncharacterized protein LOC129387306 [Dermacentor andersoni]